MNRQLAGLPRLPVEGEIVRDNHTARVFLTATLGSPSTFPLIRAKRLLHPLASRCQTSPR